MTDNVIEFPGETYGDLNPDDVIEGAKNRDFESVTIVGWTQDGDMYLSGSSANVLETIATLDIAKAALIRDMTD